MNPASNELARGDTRLAACFLDHRFVVERWLRKNDASHVALVRDGDETHVLKVGHRSDVAHEYAATQRLDHAVILRPRSHIVGDMFSALLMPYFEGAPIVDAARGAVPKRDETLRQNLPMAFGYELNDLGESSFAHCGRDGEELLRSWMRTLGDVLTYIHSMRLLHLDIAPDNVLVAGTRCALLDFGLACDMDQARRDGALIGSAAYLAPELGLGRLTPSADWYSLGVVLFQALTGGLPFEGGGPEVLIRKQSMTAPRVSELCPEVAPDLDELCASWLTRDATRRGDAAALRRLEPAP